MSTGEYTRGRKNGMWKYWWTTGEFWREVEFINGIEQTDASLSCEGLEW